MKRNLLCLMMTSLMAVVKGVEATDEATQKVVKANIQAAGGADAPVVKATIGAIKKNGNLT